VGRLGLHGSKKKEHASGKLGGAFEGAGIKHPALRKGGVSECYISKNGASIRIIGHLLLFCGLSFHKRHFEAYIGGMRKNVQKISP
jgi:hypothetical protein